MLGYNYPSLPSEEHISVAVEMDSYLLLLARETCSSLNLFVISTQNKGSAEAAKNGHQRNLQST